MSEIVTAAPANTGGPPSPLSLLDPLRNPALDTADRLRAFAAQPPVRKALPWFAGVAALGLAAVTWSAFSTPPQRVLYSALGDGERAGVAAALDKASIGYTIDNATGALTVAEGDLYRARMLVASENALAVPQTGAEMLDSLPMGASRTLEGDRLRAAQERELTLTIAEIDGVESVRVHLARPERSVFVREDAPPSASVMVRMAPGRQLADSQVTAIANLVAASVPGLSVDAVRIVDQHGRLLSQPGTDDSDRLNLQSRMESKMRTQVAQLLTPMLGEGNFTSEIQVELDMNETTSARESYDKDGSIRRETEQQSQTVGGAAIGVPGVLSNTPPPPASLEPGAPSGGPAGPSGQTTGESSATRSYELGREVAVSNNAPGAIRRLSVAVALSKDAMDGASAGELKKLEQLIGAAVGINPDRGDQVAVIVRPFEIAETDAIPFWETGWFAMVLRNAMALVVVLLILLLAVRPLMKSLIAGAKGSAATGEGRGLASVPALAEPAEPMTERERLGTQIELARQLVREKPDDALVALRKMLGGSTPDAEPAR